MSRSQLYRHHSPGKANFPIENGAFLTENNLFPTEKGLISTVLSCVRSEATSLPAGTGPVRRRVAAVLLRRRVSQLRNRYSRLRNIPFHKRLKAAPMEGRPVRARPEALPDSLGCDRGEIAPAIARIECDR